MSRHYQVKSLKSKVPATRMTSKQSSSRNNTTPSIQQANQNDASATHPIALASTDRTIQDDCFKFDGTMFHQWRREAQDYLYISGVWDLITNGPNQHTTESDLRLASYCLRHSLAPNVKNAFPSDDQAHDLYRAILERYQGRDIVHATNLRQKLTRITLTKGRTILEYVSELSNIYEELAQSGQPLSQETQVVMITLFNYLVT